MTNSYNGQENETVSIIQNWLGREGLQFIQTLNNDKQDKSKNNTGLSKVLSEKFKPQYNETSPSLKYCKLITEKSESAKELMAHSRFKQSECEYKEKLESLKNSSSMA